MEVRQGVQLNQIGAEDNGEEVLVMARDEVAIVVALGTLEDVVDFGETLMGGVLLVGAEDLMCLWNAMFAGCVAIWHVTIPVRCLSHRVIRVIENRGI